VKTAVVPEQMLVQFLPLVEGQLQAALMELWL
jgi:hypothetical protein